MKKELNILINRPALVLYVWCAIVAALLVLLSLPFVCLLVSYIFLSSESVDPAAVVIITSFESLLISAGVALFHQFKKAICKACTIARC